MKSASTSGGPFQIPVTRMEGGDVSRPEKSAGARKLMNFISDREGRVNREIDPVQQLMLGGGSWSADTLAQYNSAVSKFMKFGKEHSLEKRDLLPAKERNVRLFIQWPGTKVEGEEKTNKEIKPTTIEAYLSGLRAWHLFHHKKFPDIDQKEINLCIKALRLPESRHQQQPQ